MPIDFKLLDKEGKLLYREWTAKTKEHNGYKVKNKYHQNKDMSGWDNKLKEINTHYRTLLKTHQEKLLKERKELEIKRQEEEKKLNELKEKEKEMAKIQRELNKEKKIQALKRKTLRRSSRLANKANKRTRCPNGTRKNKKTGNCEKKK